MQKFWHSLQARLMLISVATTVAVLGGAGGLATWRLHQELLASTKALHDEVGQRLIQDIETYQEMYAPEEAVQRAVTKYTRPDLQLRVVTQAGEVLAVSQEYDQVLMANADLPTTPEFVMKGGRSLIVCGQPMTLDDNTEVDVESVSDVTGAYRAYQAFLQTLFFSGLVAVGGASVGGLLLIQQSLRPLQKISQVAANVSADDLQEARLVLENPPLEVRRLADAFNAMLNRLSRSWSQEQQLLSNISHELRTPLAIVQGYLESTLRRGSNLTEIQTENLAVSLEETQRVVRLLKDLMDLTRAEIGAFHLQLATLSLNDFLREFVDFAQYLGPHPLHLDVPEQDIWVRVDRDRLKQILLNLVSNAMRYSEEQSPVVLRLRVTTGMTEIQVQDQGVGIAAEHLPHIFDRFYCVSDARNRQEGGIGLGLAITKALVENMRGKISVESQVQGGTTFTILFPTTQSSTALAAPSLVAAPTLR